MECNAGLLGDFPYVLDRHYDACFVIYVHHGYKNGLRSDCLFKFVKTYEAVRIDVEIGYLEALPFEILAGVENGRMLDLGGYYVVTLGLFREGRAFYREVVALGAGARGYGVNRRAIQERAHLF